MTASSRGSKATASVIRSSQPRPRPRQRHPQAQICSDCISKRTYAIAAASLKTLDNAPNSELPHVRRAIPQVTSSPPSHYIPKAGLLLSRPPLLTAPQTNFEKAFFFYQKRLNERLTMPFTRYFYFKKDTPGDTDWKIKAKERNGVPAKELGGYNPYSREGWNDELLVREKGLVEPKMVRELLVKDAVVRVADGGVEKLGEGEGEEELMSRVGESDRKREFTRLDRRMDRTLYLVVKRENGGWGFPAGVLEGRENLHQAAERILVQTAGLNMNTWIVGHVPVGHHIAKPRYLPDSTLEKPGEKTFFMKARIMAGQADLKDNLFGLSEFKWLTKEEVAKHVASRYYSWVKNMMADR